MELDFRRLNAIGNSDVKSESKIVCEETDKSRVTCSVDPVFSCSKCGGSDFYYKIYFHEPNNIMVRLNCRECGHAENLPHIENLKKRSPSLSTKWREDVLKRDSRRCRICGATKNLEAHHIIPVAADKDAKYIYDRNNGITLCHTCHSMIPNYM